jgi:alkanesulfonate monooxygenase SsuD/methylene tetrahydromethanopterin reductase-like flavin-dependent oxidoreductase (luciferase family)
MSDAIAATVAALALAITAAQWFASRGAQRVRFLLGEREAVGYQAMRISHRPGAFVTQDEIRALILAATFESSDRARLQVYRALDVLRDRHEASILAFRRDRSSSTGQNRQSQFGHTFSIIAFPDHALAGCRRKHRRID